MPNPKKKLSQNSGVHVNEHDPTENFLLSSRYINVARPHAGSRFFFRVEAALAIAQETEERKKR